MSNYKKYIRVNDEWEELCPDALSVTTGSGMFIENNILYARAYLSASSSATPAYSSSTGSLVMTFSDVAAQGMNTVLTYGLEGSVMTFQTSAVPFFRNRDFICSAGAWTLPIQGDNQRANMTDPYAVIVASGHQGYVRMITSNWDAATDTGTGTFTMCSWPDPDATLSGEVTETTESGNVVHRVTLGYGPDHIAISPFFTKPTYWKNFLWNAHFRIYVASVDVTNAPDVTYLRIPYYDGNTETYTDFPLRYNGNYVDATNLGGAFLEVSFTDSTSRGFVVTNRLP